MRKYAKQAVGAIIIAVMLTGCGKSGSPSTTEATTTQITEATTVADATTTEDGTESDVSIQEQESTQTVAGWEITVEDTQREKKLEDISVVLGYTDVGTNEFSKEAAEGCEFFLIKMIFNKASSKESVDWANLTLKDQDGNIYQRMDDAFITDLNMKRLSGTVLNFGSNEGWLAFEIKDTATELIMEYPFENETYTYKFK